MWHGRRPRAATALAVLAPALLALVLGLIELGTRSLWLDEGASIAIASQHGSALWHGIRHDGGNMLVYYLLLHVLIDAFGSGIYVLRLPSVIAQALSAGLVALVALRLFGRPRVALVAGALTALSTPLIFWAQDARGYALMVTLGICSFLAFLAIVQSPRRIPWLGALGYVVSTLLSLYIGFDSVLLVVAQLALLLVYRGRARVVLACLAVVVACCVPLVILAVARGSSQLFWVTPLNGRVLGESVVVLTSGGLPPNFHVTVWTALASAFCALALIGVMGALGRRLWRGPVAVASLWLLVPLVAALLAVVADEPIEIPRASTLLIPAISLLLAYGLVGESPAWLGARRARVALGVLVALLVLRAIVLIPTYGTSPENWKAAADYLLARAPVGSCVAFYPQDGRESLDYYLRGSRGSARLRPVFPAVAWSRVRPFVELYPMPSRARLRRIVSSCPNLYLVASHQGQSQGPPGEVRDLRNYRALKAELAFRYPSQVSRGFGYAAVVWVTRYSR